MTSDRYRIGQLDVLDWLHGDCSRDDVPLAQICADLQHDAWSWCLSRNLAIGAALCEAFDLGDSHGLERGMFPELQNEAWFPGCQRAVGT